MTELKITDDQKRLLIIISKFSKPAKSRDDEETWLKKIPLMSLINRGIHMNIFKTYDFAPMLVDYMGSTRYANISKEGEDDVADLREMGFVERLKLATSHHVYVSAYRITHKGIKFAASLDKKYHSAANDLLKCGKCDGDYKIEAKIDAPYLICKKCNKKEKVEIFNLEEVSYKSSPIFFDIWLPSE